MHKIVDALNHITAQAYAVLLLIFGILFYWMAIRTGAYHDVQTAIVGSAGAVIGAALMLMKGDTNKSSVNQQIEHAGGVTNIGATPEANPATPAKPPAPN